MNERKDGVEESETTEMELEDISSGTLEIVLSYMKLKREYIIFPFCQFLERETFKSPIFTSTKRRYST